MSLKAYKLSCRDDDHGARIVFATRGKNVRGYSTDMCDCDFIDRYVHRDERFDKYAPGPVTAAQYLAEGWYWDCSGCGKTMHGDDGPIYTATRVFCDRECMDRQR